jgi:hypothetical protein
MLTPGRSRWKLLQLLLIHVVLAGVIVGAAEVMTLGEICPEAAHAYRVWNDAFSVAAGAWLLIALVVVFWWRAQRRRGALWSLGWTVASLVVLYAVVHIEAQPGRCSTF